MRYKWTITQIEHAPYEITVAKEKELIAELAQVMYNYFRQLQKKIPKSICSQNSSKPEEERTGRKYA